jgi:hypothetical protein
MIAESSKTLVHVYSTPIEFDAELVKAMLADEGIPSYVEDSNGPFPGLSGIPCHVQVAIEHELLARQLIEEHEERHRERVERELANEEEESLENELDSESELD